jgi:CRISPR system Cascade subunit CasE
MNLSRIRLRPDAAQTDTFWKRFTSDYSIHKLVWSWFADSPDRRRDFLYRQERAEGSQRDLHSIATVCGLLRASHFNQT